MAPKTAEEERQLAARIRKFSMTNFEDDVNYLHVLHTPPMRSEVFTLDMIKELNRAALEGQDDEVRGYIRRFGEMQVGTHKAPSGDWVEVYMIQFISWLNEEKNRGDIVRFAAEAHIKLAQIHPFLDGNGRTCRLLVNLILAKKGYGPVELRKDWRHEYNRVIRDYDVAAFTTELIDLLRKKEETTASGSGGPPF